MIREKYSKVLITVLLVLLTVGQATAIGQVNQGTKGLLTVQGKGSVEVRPDQSIVQFTIESQSLSALEAQEMNAKKSEVIIAALKVLGFEDDEIKAQNIRLYELWDYLPEGRKSLGYKAEYSLKVIINDIELTGQVLDTVVKLGAERINGIEFGLQDRTQAESEALRQAFAHARSRAEVLANAAGIELGVPSLIVDQTAIVAPITYAIESSDMVKTMLAYGERGATTDVQPGTIVVEASVKLQFSY